MTLKQGCHLSLFCKIFGIFTRFSKASFSATRKPYFSRFMEVIEQECLISLAPFRVSKNFFRP